MKRQEELASLLVEELRKRGALEEVVCDYGIETVRECNGCHRLMDEGWLFRGYETFCSDECLIQAHPEVDLEVLRSEASTNDSDSYWTTWEG